MSTMTLSMNEDGSLQLVTGLHDPGCGTQRSMQIIVGEALDIPPDQVHVSLGDTRSGVYDAGTYGSRVTYVAGRCAYETACLMKKRLLQLGAEILGLPENLATVLNGGVSALDGTGSFLSFRSLATQALDRLLTDICVTHTCYAKDNPGVYSVHFCEVLVDTYTGQVSIPSYLVSQDVGRAINRSMVDGQLTGAVNMCVGYALSEELKLNPQDGGVINGTYRKYHIPNMCDMPHVDTLILEFGGDSGPYEAKSVGEIACVPGAAAIVNAVNNAIGGNLTQLPLTPERILAFLNRKEDLC